MQTITRKDTNVSLYLYPDDVAIVVTSENIVVGDPPELVIGDCNSSNADLYTGVTDPGDWQGWKYLYTTENGWELNPDWDPPA